MIAWLGDSHYAIPISPRLPALICALELESFGYGLPRIHFSRRPSLSPSEGKFMISQVWRVIGVEKRQEFVRQGFSKLQSDERFLIIEALCDATGERFPQVSRRTTGQLVVEIVPALARMRVDAIRLLMERRYETCPALFADFSFRFAGRGPFAPESLLELRRFDEFVQAHGWDESLLACAFAAMFGEEAGRDAAKQIAKALLHRGPGETLTASMQEAVAEAPVDTAGGSRSSDCDAAHPSPSESGGTQTDHAIPPVEGVSLPAAAADDVAPAGSTAVRAAGLSDDWSSELQREDELDRVVIRAIVGAQHREVGALPCEAVDRLVETVLLLNTSRFRSYFYVGFVQAFRGLAFSMPETATNPARRAWYVSGYFTGARRKLGTGDFLCAVSGISGSDAEALRDPSAQGAVQRLGPLVVAAALEQGDAEVVERWLGWMGPCDAQVVRRVAAFALREPWKQPEGDVRLSLKVVEVLAARRAMEGVESIDPDEAELLLGAAGLIRDAGKSHSAADILGVEAGSWGDFESPRTTALFATESGLAHSSALVPRSASGFREVTNRIQSALETGAVCQSSSLHLIGVLCEAMVSLAEGAAMSTSDVRQLLAAVRDVRSAIQFTGSTKARLASIRTTELDTALGVHAALLALLGVIEESAEEAVSTLEEWIGAGKAVPVEYLKLALANAALMNCRGLPRLFAQAVQRFGAEVVDYDALSGVAANAESHGALLDLVSDSTVPMLPGQRWELCMAIGRHAARAARDPDTALRCLQLMQDLAEREPTTFGPRLIGVLADQVWMPVLEEDARDSIAIAAAELIGDYDVVVEGLLRQLRRAVHEQRPALAVDILELMDARDMGPLVPAELRTRVIASGSSAQRSVAAARQGRAVRILFVGGNEIQARWDREVEEWIRREFSGVGVTWIHPGWSSNWNKPLSEVERELPRHGAVVLMKFVRTIFGEKVRKFASEHDRPWIPCTGHGLSSVKRAIEAAVVVARGDHR